MCRLTLVFIHFLGQAQISCISGVIFEGFVTMYIKITVFWGVRLCELVARYQRPK